MGYLIIDYIISFIVLLVIHAPWWAWVIYAVSAVVWFVIWSFCDSETNRNPNDISKQEQL